MADSLERICKTKLPTIFQESCSTFGEHLEEISEFYLHDYNDQEICSDIGFCEPKDLGIPRKPTVMDH